MADPNESSLKFQSLKRLIPSSLKRATKDALMERKFRRAMRKLTELPEGRLPTREMLAELQSGWGNESFAARYDYLDEIIKRAATTPGPILECGSGLTTVLLGLFAGRRGVETWSLEHTPQWQARVETILQRHRVPRVRICLSPLSAYDGFSWYAPPLDALPEKFSLVVCDGPPGTTDGGRYGLLPVLGERLSDASLILLDDADREGEAEVLRRWIAEEKVSVRLHESSTGAYAEVRRG